MECRLGFLVFCAIGSRIRHAEFLGAVDELSHDFAKESGVHDFHIIEKAFPRIIVRSAPIAIARGENVIRICLKHLVNIDLGIVIAPLKILFLAIITVEARWQNCLLCTVGIIARLFGKVSQPLLIIRPHIKELTSRIFINNGVHLTRRALVTHTAIGRITDKIGEHRPICGIMQFHQERIRTREARSWAQIRMNRERLQIIGRQFARIARYLRILETMISETRSILLDFAGAGENELIGRANAAIRPWIDSTVFA